MSKFPAKLVYKIHEFWVVQNSFTFSKTFVMLRLNTPKHVSEHRSEHSTEDLCPQVSILHLLIYFEESTNIKIPRENCLSLSVFTAPCIFL